MDELIVLLDDSYQPIGSAPKLASHHDKTPLHLAFSCYIFNQKGELLLTQRAATKKVWPTVWTNSVCGHPGPGESLEAALERRAQFELGIRNVHDVQNIIPDYRYQTPPYNGIVENEFCPVFAATVDVQPQPNPAEVADFRWVKPETLPSMITASPTTYSYWFKDQLQQLGTRDTWKDYQSQLRAL